ncbi:leucine-rich repeat-containing protein 57-like [Limulus polyphemus]|uniref:Leucine-rich repeat-containing protein 57-like n=1 Tax=Limulus polyphemus TaxID=6850 RepID=A0ABM1BIG0_LIMPO|nr:leucine-rich repeat-containing protein 57-like [Limulus polyphemus]
MGNSIKPHIQTAEKTGVCQLVKNGLNDFPRELLPLTQVLRTLDLSDNKISTLPGAIGNFSQLKHLIMNNNRISFLPEELGKLKKLETLSMNNNHILTFPSSISDLINLRSVYFSGNCLTDFPVVFCNLRHLELLDLSQNKISQVPEIVKNLHVTELNINQNQISLLSEAIADCPRLKVLRVEENCLPLSAVSGRILTDSQISLLAVDGNLFEMKEFHGLEGYEKYMERYTATKKKMY